jgi:4-diphosphocytidyl-2-C-methyl-D-erythritol kinase
MLVFPNAKINLGLNVIEKREDGFHNIESCFYPVPWFDALEVIESDILIFSSSGIDIPGESNICVEAYELLKLDFDLPPVSIHLFKNIPIGAGLGGGSADGAFMLKLLDEKFSLNLNSAQLRQYAAQLGSDCPFFIDNIVSFVEGTGDTFSSIDMDLKGLFLAIVYPNIHVDTAMAYRNISPTIPKSSLKSILENTSLDSWRNKITNDFEINATEDWMELKNNLYALGALYASMSGSGSAVYGLFNSAPNLNTAHKHIIGPL